jgi:hypothetical protein
MSDKMRWRYGQTNPVVSAVDSATVIEMGDLLYQDKHELGASAKPGSMQVDTGPRSHHAKQMEFADNFLGVAMQRSRSGDMNPVRVATTGVFEFDCPSGTFELGDLVGSCWGYAPQDPPNDSKGTQLLNQEVDSVSSSKYAIGRVAKREATAATTVLIDIRSTVMTGGIEGSSPSGV